MQTPSAVMCDIKKVIDILRNFNFSAVSRAVKLLCYGFIIFYSKFLNEYCAPQQISMWNVTLNLFACKVIFDGYIKRTIDIKLMLISMYWYIVLSILAK